MDVDQSSSSKRPRSTSSSPVSSSKKRAKNLLTDAEERKVIEKMKSYNFTISLYHVLAPLVLSVLAIELQSTGQRNCFITPPSYPDARNIVNEFSEVEMEQWKSGMRNGIENDDWYGLIMHRTYILNYQVILRYLIGTSERLQAPSQPAAMGLENRELIDEYTKKGLCWGLTKPSAVSYHCWVSYC